jgi:hypothetical protein
MDEGEGAGMRYEYKAAIVGGIPLGISMLCFLLMVSPRRQWEILFFFLSGGIGALLSYFCYKTSPNSFSLKKGTVVGASVGLAAGFVYFVSSAIIYFVAVDIDIILNVRSLSLAVIGIVQLIVASGLGGLVVGLLSKLGRRSSVIERSED